MDEIYVTYVDDEHVDNHDYDDNTDDDRDNNNDINGHKSMIYQWSIDRTGRTGRARPAEPAPAEPAPSPGIFEHSIARYKMILTPVDSKFNFLQF